jgi:hypothetical protein
MSSTRKTPKHRGSVYNLPEPAAAAAAATAAAVAEAVTAAMDAEAAAAAVASGFGGVAAEAAEAVGTAGYGPAGAGFGLANESALESKNIQHARDLGSSSWEASGVAVEAICAGCPATVVPGA